MNFRVFQYVLPAPATLDDLNSYLAAHRVASVSQHLVPVTGGTLLVFIVETVGAAPAVVEGGGLGKVDYREKLGSEDFALFSRLRDERKRWAETEGVPVYTVFTNAQLAAMAQKRPRSAAELAAVEGIGPARIEKYGARLLELVAGASPAGVQAASASAAPGGAG